MCRQGKDTNNYLCDRDIERADAKYRNGFEGCSKPFLIVINGMRGRLFNFFPDFFCLLQGWTFFLHLLH